MDEQRTYPQPRMARDLDAALTFGERRRGRAATLATTPRPTGSAPWRRSRSLLRRQNPATERRRPHQRQPRDNCPAAAPITSKATAWTGSGRLQITLRNTLLIALQCPHATHVAGFRRWLELGRCVRKGEKAIRIFAPVRYRQRNAQQAGPEKNEPQLVGFKLAAVFDVSQTDPLPGVEPIPLEPPGEPVSGDSHSHLIGQLEQHAATLGYSVAYEQLDGPSGYCSAREARIVIDSQLPANGKVATLVHEIAHAHGDDYKTYSRPEAELIVESVAFIVCGAFGLDTGGESVAYLTDWNPDQPAERIQLLAGKIDDIARNIEQALDGPPADEGTSPASPPA